MKVHELIKHLETLKQDSEVFVAVRKGDKPIANLKPVNELQEALEQDTNQLHYWFDVDIEPMYRIPEDKIIKNNL
ncbi:hypothetical protein [Bacillus sp. V2I10]|uniref:hypothetical protein n=1 Tax=Bacillus sp. V2I10 TaxID=3042276 RepID=UPI002781EE72|nr:hypothetical protein [Bacillus sp. V2I10]MDQ0860009.1 hypothetical protein [Bacillus sp. V2I10]